MDPLGPIQVAEAAVVDIASLAVRNRGSTTRSCIAQMLRNLEVDPEITGCLVAKVGLLSFYGCAIGMHTHAVLGVTKVVVAQMWVSAVH